MAKIKKIFICSECGASSPKWMGKCPSCESWNTYQEEIISKPTATELKRASWAPKEKDKAGSKPVLVSDIQTGQRIRYTTPDQELNRVLGGGIVQGSLILIGGQPGIGKSTLMLQVALKMDKARILYVSGEESEEQIKMRAERISSTPNNCYILNETNISKIIKHTQNLEPDLVIIDSVQTLSSPFIDSMPGSISQIRECAGELQRFAKSEHVPIFVIGHITKDGSIAGPKL
jgi:DNA repair protein RadA/Sms